MCDVYEDLIYNETIELIFQKNKKLIWIFQMSIKYQIWKDINNKNKDYYIYIEILIINYTS